MRTVKSFLSLLLIMAVTIPGFAEAKDTQKVGKITAVSGSSEVKKSGGTKQIKAFKSMAITQGDTIITGRNGKVNMDLDSDKEVIVGPNTKLVISQLVQNARAMSGKTNLSLLGGSVMVKVKKKLTGDSRFEIKTPTAIMGVMGTQFIVEYREGNSFVGVIEGTVAVSKPDGAQGPSVHANEQVHLNSSGDGVPETLILHDLPLFALEQYAEDVEQMLENHPTPDLQTLKEQLEKVRKEKQQAQGDEQEDEEQPESPVIIYEGTAPSRDRSDRGSSGGGGGSPGGGDPTPVVRPSIVSQGVFHPIPDQRTDLNIELALAGDSLKTVFYSTGERNLEEGTDYRLESGTQSGQQTIVLLKSFLQDRIGDRNSFELKFTFTSGYTLFVTVKAREVKSPQLDIKEFYNNLHVYVPNNKTFILPFTTHIQPNVTDDLIDETQVLQDGVILQRVDFPPYEWKQNDSIMIEENKLKIELGEGIPIGSLIDITVVSNTLKNKETGDVQEEEQRMQELRLEPSANPDFIEVDPINPQEIAINIMGFGFPLRELKLEFPPNDSGPDEAHVLVKGTDYEVNSDESTPSRLTLKSPLIQQLTEYGEYTLRVYLETPEEYQLKIALFRKP
ncbi:FecR family protein [Aneurinibacillus aneurinilyticus]|uniref:FecR family protein n=1 Tax=Aneurinibacillus aneurinilyticus TaxID=1391 RepID=UPI0023F7D31F|nr:FecR domain-containing protein [Aneurinibacillus aneurinilyticus]MCI1693105.1 FecR domain-containing protein [Aneurinibacillus aneurinilyticus]